MLLVNGYLIIILLINMLFIPNYLTKINNKISDDTIQKKYYNAIHKFGLFVLLIVLLIVLYKYIFFKSNYNLFLFWFIIFSIALQVIYYIIYIISVLIKYKGIYNFSRMDKNSILIILFCSIIPSVIFIHTYIIDFIKIMYIS